ncbi:MAG: hypothetical protein ABIP75_02950 [Pyrinomonadaceae bacterium]
MEPSRVDTIMAQARGFSPDELAQLIKQAADLLAQKQSLRKHRNYASLIGSGKGGFSSAEEADRFIRMERDEWEP